MTGPIDHDAEANYFAMCLLMPEDMLRADISKSNQLAWDILDDAYIANLASRYQVTPQLMLMRLIDLGYMRVR